MVEQKGRNGSRRPPYPWGSWLCKSPGYGIQIKNDIISGGTVVQWFKALDWTHEDRGSIPGTALNHALEHFDLHYSFIVH